MMRLHSGNLYWNKTKNNKIDFSKLEKSIETDILIVGGGMSGTLTAYVLASQGMSVTVVERGKIAEGSSAANTGLLQYTSDKMLSEFTESIGEKSAVAFYRMCLEAMDQLTSINDALTVDTGYRKRESIYFASTNGDALKLKKEFELLTKHDFPVEFLDADILQEKYGIQKPCALRTWHDAEVNPYKFILALTEENVKMGVKYYEHTEIDLNNLQTNKSFTKEGHSITFNNIILTTGYVKQYDIISDKSIIHRTYALCTEPVQYPAWPSEVMVWETKNPYLYFRTTPDHRIIAGGLDEETNAVESDVNKINEKALEITSQIEAIFPHLKLTVSHAWNALFGESIDGLPFIGSHPEKPTLHYLLGFEGNGTCYSMAGALILADLLKGIPNNYADIVKVNR